LLLGSLLLQPVLMLGFGSRLMPLLLHLLSRPYSLLLRRCLSSRGRGSLLLLQALLLLLHSLCRCCLLLRREGLQALSARQ
jgi:hypothetical protein